MKITDRIASGTKELTRPLKKNLSKQEIRDLVTSNKTKKLNIVPEGDKNPRNPRSPQNIERLKEALSNGTITFSPQERAILEKLVSP